MAIFKQEGVKLLPVKEKKIDLERTVQSLVERNLYDVFGLEFICTEFALNGLRVDTLAFSRDTNSFVIIEYKKDRSFSVIDQGYAYLALLLNNKADFILEYNEKSQKTLKKDDIDWSQSRVVFLANTFTKYQQEAIGFQDLPIELWEVNLFDNNLVIFNQLKATEKSESIKTVVKGKNVDIVSKEIKQYSLSDHLRPGWDKTKELFDSLSRRMLDTDSRFEINPVQSYIGFRIGSKNVVNVKPRSTKIIIELLRTQPQDLKDPESRVEYFKNSYKFYNQHVSLFEIENDEDLDYAMMLIKQVYKKLF